MPSRDPERQEYVFNKIYEILYTEFIWIPEDEARHFFNDLRQLTIDWNYILKWIRTNSKSRRGDR
ncbi:MAG: hypothetical protein U5N26_11070 [Candidatus Marinimicrobia bacterium]|nr:hypothetical protein [Candidatus Neomarinimicrobiota bacterium]